jgi:hypothetical protein
MAVRDRQPSHLTDYGFVWGPMEVTRLAEFDGRVVVQIATTTGQMVEVHVSPTGRSLRVFKPGKGEMKAVSDGRA